MAGPQVPNQAKLDGLNPLSYMGVRPSSPPQLLVQTRNPSTNDNKYVLGTLWLNNFVPYDLWILVNLNKGIALWQLLGGGGGGTVNTLTSNIGGPVPPAGGNINVVGDGVTISGVGNPGTSTITFSVIGGGGAATSFPTDLGIALPLAGVLDIFGGAAGRNTNTSGVGNVVRVNLNNAITLGDLANLGNTNAITVNTGNISLLAGRLDLPVTDAGITQGAITISGTRFLHSHGSIDNTFLGLLSGNTPPTGAFNTTVGYRSGFGLGTGTSNTAMGADAFEGGVAAGTTTGSDNTAIGRFSGAAITSGSRNTGLGSQTLIGIISGTDNIHIGYQSGQNALGPTSSNILIGNFGAVEDNTIRIGTTGVGLGQQSRFFVGGTFGVNVGSVATVVSIANTGQIGSTTITGGAGITVTPGAGTITISATGSGTVTLNYTNVTTTPYVVLTTDEFLSVNTSALAITVQLPNAPATGRTFIIKDRIGQAATRNITVTTVGGAVLIDGAATFVMNTAFEAINVLFNGTSYEVY